MSSQHLSVPNDPNKMEDTEKRQPPNCAAQDQSALLMAECLCATSHMSNPTTANTAEMAFRTMAPSAEKRKSNFDSKNSCFGISKKLKAFNNCVHCPNHMNPKAHPQPQHMENKISSSPELLTFPSELSEHQNEANVMLGHSVLLEAAITAAVQTVLRCSFCPTSLKDLNALQEHVRQSHNPALIENNVFFCSQCFRGFLTKDTLDNHVQLTHCLKLDPDPEETAERKSLIFCPYCTHLPTFNNKLKLMQHIKKTHKNINLMNLKDGRMIMGSTAPQSVKNPVKKTALPSTDFKCDHCGAKYNDLDLFQTHLTSHLKSMLPNLRCPECFKDLPTTNLLRNTPFLILAIPLLSTSVKAAVRPSPVSKTCMDIYSRCTPLCFTAAPSARRCSVPSCLFRFTWPPSTVTRVPRSTVHPANGTLSKSMTCTCTSNRSISTNNARCTVASSVQSPLPRTLSCSVISQHIATNVPRPDLPSRCPYTRNSVPRARALKVTT